ncbi:MAG: Ppx/GppA phosphatase family protein [Rhodothermales bacterium]|nr:Ppx/GppA phosphatase family protein [Rhodothermales bacterium]
MPTTIPAPEPMAAPDGRAGVRLCVIDLGSNSFHAIIVDALPDGTFSTVERQKEMVKLGEGGFRSHRLTEAAQERGIAALKAIRAMAEGHGVSEFVACATSAVREATNGGAFIERVKDETGIYVRTITGETEAELIYQAVRQEVDLTEPTLLVDIGGGSTEFIVADRDGAHFLTSLKLGAARLTEEFVTTDPVVGAEFKALRAHVRGALGPVFRAAHDRGVRRVVGSSGTLQSIAAATAAAYGEPDRIFDYVFDVANVRRITKGIMTADRAQRLATPGVQEKRVDQIVAGAVLTDVVLKDLAVQRFEVSPVALREGIVIDFIRRNYQWLRRLAPFHSVRRRSVYDLAMRLGWDEGHVRQVTRLALRLFDATRPLHGRGEWARELLEYASVLRDVGYAISRRSHHKHSYYVISHADLKGFTPEEIALVANVARYHRAGLPSGRHAAYARLSEEHQRLVNELAALLRLANGLDRSHFQNVIHLDPDLADDRLTLRLQTKADPQLDVWAAERGAALFRRTFDRPVAVVAEAG